MAETLVDKLIKELEGKDLSELKRMGRQEQEQLSQAEERLKDIKDGKIPLTSPEELKPISVEEVNQILEEAEKAVVIAGIVGAWKRCIQVAEEAKRQKVRWLEEAVVYTTVRDILRGGSQAEFRRRPSKRPNQFPTRPGWIKVDEICAKCRTRVTSLPFQPMPGEPVYCPPCWMELKAKPKTKAPKTKT